MIEQLRQLGFPLKEDSSFPVLNVDPTYNEIENWLADTHQILIRIYKDNEEEDETLYYGAIAEEDQLKIVDTGFEYNKLTDAREACINEVINYLLET